MAERYPALTGFKLTEALRTAAPEACFGCRRVEDPVEDAYFMVTEGEISLEQGKQQVADQTAQLRLDCQGVGNPYQGNLPGVYITGMVADCRYGIRN